MSTEDNQKAFSWLQKAKDGLTIAWIGGSNIVKRGWTIWVLGIALIGAATYMLYVAKQKDEAMAQLQASQASLQEAIIANQATTQAIIDMQADMQRTFEATQRLNQKLEQDNQVFNSIAGKLDKLEDGKVAPVLRETLREVQHLRETQ